MSLAVEEELDWPRRGLYCHMLGHMHTDIRGNTEAVDWTRLSVV